MGSLGLTKWPTDSYYGVYLPMVDLPWNETPPAHSSNYIHFSGPIIMVMGAKVSIATPLASPPPKYGGLVHHAVLVFSVSFIGSEGFGW